MKRDERRSELENLARENGWNFSATGNVPAMRKFEFQTGEKREIERIENLIEDDNFKTFDVYWQTEFKPSDAFGPLAHKNMSANNVREQTIILFESANLSLPKFHVYPANSGGWLDKMFRRNDSSEFAKGWSVQGETKEFFNEKVIEFYNKSEKFWAFASGNHIFIYQPNVLIEPSQISIWMARVSRLAILLKIG
jgi:hypothetical protein